MLRIERRQWSLVIALIAVAIAGGVFLVTAGFNVAPLPNGSELGNGTHLIGADGDDIPALDAAAAAFEVADPIETASVFPPGFAAPLEVRSFDPRGSNAGPLIGLIDGRLPATADEVALTERFLTRLDATVGGELTLNDAAFTVTGIVENPLQLSQQFVFGVPGVFPPEQVSVLLTATDEEVDAFLDGRQGVWQTRSENDGRTSATVVTTMITAAILLEVALLVVSVVTMLAQRRRQQLALLGAVGANRKQLRAAVVAGGVVAGLVASVLGLLMGVAISLVAVPRLDTLADRRLESVEWPWPVIGLLAVLAVAAAAAAAWLPGRTMSRATVAGALRSSRPEPRRPLVMTSVGLLLLVAGVVMLVRVFSLNDVERPIYVDVVALLAIPIGAVLLAPALVRIWAGISPGRSLPSRMAHRDLGRYQSRSAATAAALVIVLMIPVMGATGFRIFERSADNLPTMAPEHLRVSLGLTQFGDPVAQDGESYTAAVEALVAGAEVIPLRQPIVELDGETQGPVIVQDRGPLGGVEESVQSAFREPVTLSLIVDRNGRDFGFVNVPTYIGTPEVMAALGLNGFEGGDILTNRDGDHGIIEWVDGDVAVDDDLDVVVSDFTQYSSSPGALLTPGYAESLGHPIETVAWLVVADQPFSDEDIAQITADADANGLLAEGYVPAETGAGVVRTLLLAGGLLGLGIIAVVGALHLAETAQTHTAYEAVGASRRFRRTVHGWTMGSLTLVAALLAVVAGLLSQVGFAVEVFGAGRVWVAIPVTVVLLVVAGFPIGAYAFGWGTGGAGRAGSRIRAALNR